jgi:hypothetical protein
MIAGRAPSMPNWVAMLCGWWLGVALWGYFVAFHEMARALVGGFGSPGTSVAYAIAGSIVGALPLLALLPVALGDKELDGDGDDDDVSVASDDPDLLQQRGVITEYSVEQQVIDKKTML